MLIPTTILQSTIGTGLYDAYAYIRHEVSSGTNPGTTTTSTWVTRPLNTETSDMDGIVSLSSNQFTLVAGTYLVHGRAPAVSNSNTLGNHRLRIRNITDNSTVDVGDSVMAFNAGAELTIRSLFTITETKLFELQHWTDDGRATIGMGYPSSAGVNEVYAEVEIWREGTTSGSSSGNGPTLIQEIIVPSGGSASVDFTSIPSTYRHLEIWYVARSESTAADILLRFNNDSAANYKTEVLRGVASSASAATLSAQTGGNITSVPATGSGYDSHGKIHFPYYATGAFNRIAVSNYGQWDGTNSNVGTFAAQWSGTAAITQITLYIPSIDIKEGSIFSLYGIV